LLRSDRHAGERRRRDRDVLVKTGPEVPRERVEIDLTAERLQALPEDGEVVAAVRQERVGRTTTRW